MREGSPRVLLIEEGWISTIYLAEALAEAGFAVMVLAANGGRARYERGNVVWATAPPIGTQDFRATVDRAVEEWSFDRVLPLTEAAMRSFWEVPPTWHDRIYPATTEWQRQLVCDKRRLLDEMERSGMPTPRHLGLPASLDLASAAADLKLPLLVKGATGSGGNRVRIVESLSDLITAAARARSMGGAWFLEEHVDGPTFLFGGLFRDGEPIRIYAAEKVELYPLRTGPAIELRSVRAPTLVELGIRLFRALRWNGFGSADFIRRTGDNYLLLEVNPRLWGSVAGAAAAGVDLFTPFIELLCGRHAAADLDYEPDRSSLIFPRYLMSPTYRGPRGLVQLVRDLLGSQGRSWLRPGFTAHMLVRLHWLSARWRQF